MQAEIYIYRGFVGGDWTEILTRATRRNIPEDDILHSHRRENLKSYIVLFVV
jgi:hypothetical protein